MKVKLENGVILEAKNNETAEQLITHCGAVEVKDRTQRTKSTDK